MADIPEVKLHPHLASVLPTLLATMKALGFPMQVTATIRTQSAQMALYAQGRTIPGHIVTNADGVTHRSNHQVKEDGFGHAVDCAFLIDGKPSWDIHLPWKAYGECAKALGLNWGGDWHQLADLPHIEV